MNVYTSNRSGALWNILGSFGKFTAEVSFSENRFSADNGAISVFSEIKRHPGDVYVRTGKVKNISDENVTLNALSSKFSLDGGEYEIYSQYNGWQQESAGRWQELVTGVTLRSESIRNCHSSAPFAVLWNKQTDRGIAFHMCAYSAWEMTFINKYAGGEASYVDAELGIFADGLNLVLKPGEEIELPEIIYYDVFNKTDLDCHKLHRYLNEAYPRKTVPVIYNTWLYKFDRFTTEDIILQAEKAAELGVEYFVIDAGWFGKGNNWGDTRGDWEENLTFGFRGRMAEIAELIREKGMKFGLWLEAESASMGAEIVKKHPDYFVEAEGSYLIDFSNREALEYIFSKTCELIDRYGAEFIKFDFNTDLRYDIHKTAFTAYFEGHREYILRLKEKYPFLYIENCASGGMRMSVRDGKLYDSFWLSDNQSIYHTLRIFKDSILRLPPQWIECYATVKSVPGFSPVYGTDYYGEKLISTGDATWSDVTGVHTSFLKGVLTGSPIGFSCDLAALSEKVFGELKEFVKAFKENRAFWQSAVCHILTDTDTVLVLQFSDISYTRIELVVFFKKVHQKNLCVYPAIDRESVYALPDGTERSGDSLYSDGIDFKVPGAGCNTAKFMTVKKRSAD